MQHRVPQPSKKERQSFRYSNRLRPVKVQKGSEDRKGASPEVNLGWKDRRAQARRKNQLRLWALG